MSIYPHPPQADAVELVRKGQAGIAGILLCFVFSLREDAGWWPRAPPSEAEGLRENLNEKEKAKGNENENSWQLAASARGSMR